MLVLPGHPVPDISFRSVNACRLPVRVGTVVRMARSRIVSDQVRRFIP